jgi:5-oxoprolinase (ATP-hydrolysing) subunit A
VAAFRGVGAFRGVAPRTVDLNADLGEGGPVDDEVMAVVTSASVACGFHAGGPLALLQTLRTAGRAGVVVGAHPSHADREGFGRRDLEVDPAAVHAGVVYQIGALDALARAAGTVVRYVKPHGALYNRAAWDPEMADALVRAVLDTGARPLLALAGSRLVSTARQAGLDVHEEGFADRAYAVDGSLVPRSEPGAVIESVPAVVEQALALAAGNGVPAAGGGSARVAASSICVHGDTPGALVLARTVRTALEDAGIAIRPFA